MTHLWKSSETYTFDIPSQGRVIDVYYKNGLLNLEFYLKVMTQLNIEEAWFDGQEHAYHVRLHCVKNGQRTEAENEMAVSLLLKTYMHYANADWKTLRAEIDKKLGRNKKEI